MPSEVLCFIWEIYRKASSNISHQLGAFLALVAVAAEEKATVHMQENNFASSIPGLSSACFVQLTCVCAACIEWNLISLLLSRLPFTIGFVVSKILMTTLLCRKAIVKASTSKASWGRSSRQSSVSWGNFMVMNCILIHLFFSPEISAPLELELRVKGRGGREGVVVECLRQLYSKTHW